ncbi:serine hydrolase domain-containing protein [Paraburkholderia metrosideri]|uniref:Esterase EstB n=1 Tax=Paraburkholderia metrosideri TaxID=580937 RepID=A0ABN7IBJ7_9BURK|nr:serine hydrolase domain-containing protein [Paraburkholderia metrosideri]CAD6558258.1 Esterase EstB [Paraburkholderia metrosideri]
MPSSPIPPASASASASATPAAPLSSRVDAVIDAALASQRLVGCVVLIAQHGEPVYRRAAGLADREHRQPMREDTLFRLASISKPVVSTAAMVLVGQKRLGLDDAVTRYLPEFTPEGPDGMPAPITVRHLLTHTAGLGYRFLEADGHGPYARAGVSDGMDHPDITLAENVRRIASVPLMFAPGTGWLYSLSIDVLGAVIESVTGMPLDQAVRELVTAPLEMNDSAFHALDASRLATPYVNAPPHAPHRMRDHERVASIEGVVGIDFEPARALDAQAFPSGGAGMVGSADDVLKLLDTLRQGGGKLLASELVDEMGRIQTGEMGPPDPPGFSFGLGFAVLRDPLAAASPQSPGTWRWGGAYGHSWFVDRARGLSVVALTNTLYEGMSGDFVFALRDAIYGVDHVPVGDAAQ